MLGKRIAAIRRFHMTRFVIDSAKKGGVALENYSADLAELREGGWRMPGRLTNLRLRLSVDGEIGRSSAAIIRQPFPTRGHARPKEEKMTALSRRHLLAASRAGPAGALVSKLATSAAHASDQAPGADRHHVPFYRTALGSADITVVSDGTITWAPTDLFSQVPEEELEAFLAAYHQPTDSIRLQLNAMVVDLNGRRVLIDAGCAGKWQPTGGGVPQNLRAAGIDPATIDIVVFTHLHPDHLWGITDGENGALIFPNADYVVAEPELAYWNDPDLPGRMPSDMLRQLAEINLAHLAHIEDRLRPVDAAAEAVPGIRFAA
jgi:glyoxylase-like metal-dependent hydrolase (beta-lactamase superfamily II)